MTLLCSDRPAPKIATGTNASVVATAIPAISHATRRTCRSRGLGSSLTLLLPKTSSMLVGADAWVWPMWPMLCVMAAGGAFVRRGNAVAW